MSTLGKVFVVLVGLASLGMFYTAARTLKMLDTYRTLYNAYAEEIFKAEQKLAVLSGRNEELAQKTPGHWQAERKLNILLSNRGRVWFDCASAVDNNQLVVTVEQPNPHEITDKNVLFVFEQSPPNDPSKGIRMENPPRELRYLGEFRVTEVNAQQVKLVPAGFDPQKPVPRFVQMQLARLANAQGPLALYEQMPIDIHEIWHLTQRDYPEDFARFFGAGVPPDVVKKFQHDGEPATPEDLNEPQHVLVKLQILKDFAELTPAQQKELSALGFSDVLELTPAGDPVRDAEGKEVRIQVHNLIRKDAVVLLPLASPDPTETGPATWLTNNKVAQELERVYHRPLRDYSLYFRQIYRQLPMLESRIAELERLIQTKKAEEQVTIANIEHATKEQEALKTEKGTLAKELKVVTDLRDDLLHEVKYVEARNANLEAANQKLAAQYRQAQLAHAERINREAREKTSTPGRAPEKGAKPDGAKPDK